MPGFLAATGQRRRAPGCGRCRWSIPGCIPENSTVSMVGRLGRFVVIRSLRCRQTPVSRGTTTDTFPVGSFVAACSRLFLDRHAGTSVPDGRRTTLTMLRPRLRLPPNRRKRPPVDFASPGAETGHRLGKNTTRSGNGGLACRADVPREVATVGRQAVLVRPGRQLFPSLGRVVG